MNYKLGLTYGMELNDDIKEMIATAFRKGTIHIATIERNTTNILEQDAAIKTAITVGLRIVGHDGQELIIQ